MLKHSLIFDGALPGEDAETADIHFLSVFTGQSGPDPSKMQVLEGFRGGLPGARQRTFIFYCFLQLKLTSGAKVYENHCKNQGFWASMKIAKNAKTFVNFGVLGLSGGLGPQLVRAGSQPLKKEQKEPQRTPWGTAFKNSKIPYILEGWGPFYIVKTNRKCMLAVWAAPGGGLHQNWRMF